MVRITSYSNKIIFTPAHDQREIKTQGVKVVTVVKWLILIKTLTTVMGYMGLNTVKRRI